MRAVEGRRGELVKWGRSLNGDAYDRCLLNPKSRQFQTLKVLFRRRAFGQRMGANAAHDFPE
jgi:hypothetical protein